MKNGYRRALLFLPLAMLAVGLWYAYTYAMDSPYRLDSEEAKRLLKRGEFDVVLDVRTALERQALGGYPGSVHMPSAELAERMPLEVPQKDARILVYCNTGQRARKATETLHALGYRNARYIAGSHLSLMN